jgi:hypothetical protein
MLFASAIERLYDLKVRSSGVAGDHHDRVNSGHHAQLLATVPPNW